MNNSRPNVVLVLSDEQWAGAMSCAGNNELFTPNMDQLAGEGMHFTHAICAQPLCLPSRATIMTGVMPHTHGMTVNPCGNVSGFVEGALDGRWPLMGRIFTDAGYATAYFGKWHLPVSKKDTNTHGFTHVVDDRDGVLPTALAGFLQEGNRPFLAVVSFLNPHNICEWARGEPLPDATLPPPPQHCPPLPPNFEIPDREPGWIREFQRRRARYYLTPGYSENQWRQYRWAYWRLCEEVDRQIGLLMAVLRMNGLDEHTLIVFTSDHGDGVGAHRWSQKQVFYEEPVRVPLIVRPPGGISGLESSRLTNAGIDILPTLLDYAGVNASSDLQGCSLRPVVEQHESTRPEYVVSEIDFCSGTERWGAGGRMVRSDRYKYCIYDKLHANDIAEQFFDLQADPGEMCNLIARSAVEQEVTRHRQMLREWQRDTGDEWISRLT